MDKFSKVSFIKKPEEELKLPLKKKKSAKNFVKLNKSLFLTETNDTNDPPN
jgi:hypothetical protein